MPRFIRPGFDKYSFNKCYNEHDGLKEDHADLQDLHKLLQHRIAFLRATKDLNSQSLHQEFVKVKVRLDGWIAELEELGKAQPQSTERAWLTNR